MRPTSTRLAGGVPNTSYRVTFVATEIAWLSAGTASLALFSVTTAWNVALPAVASDAPKVYENGTSALMPPARTATSSVSRADEFLSIRPADIELDGHVLRVVAVADTHRDRLGLTGFGGRWDSWNRTIPTSCVRTVTSCVVDALRPSRRRDRVPDLVVAVGGVLVECDLVG